MSLRLTLVAALALAATTVLAQRVPPENGMPLSQIIANVEANPDMRDIREIKWVDDEYRRVGYTTTSGHRGRARLDPIKRGTWSRR